MRPAHTNWNCISGQCPDFTNSLEREKKRGATELNVRSGTACCALRYIMIATTLRFGLNAQENPVYSFMMRPTLQKHFYCFCIFLLWLCLHPLDQFSVWLPWQESHTLPRPRPHVKVKQGVVLKKFKLGLMSHFVVTCVGDTNCTYWILLPLDKRLSWNINDPCL